MKLTISDYWYTLKIVLLHKWYVFLECCKKGHVILGIRHDLSKLWPSEFLPYVKYLKDKKESYLEKDDKFLYSKFLHMKRTKHHFEYWLFLHYDSIYPMKMPQKYVDEMLIDWKVANRYYSGNDTGLEEWYVDNRHRIILHPDTRKFVDKAMNYHLNSF